MKQILLTTTFLLLVSTHYVIGQKYELRLSSGIGISTTNIDSEDDRIVSEIPSKLIPICLDFNYKILPENKVNFFLGSGLKYLNNGYFQNLQSLEYGYNLREIKFTQKHLGFPLRFGSELKIFNSNYIGFQYEVQYNLALKKETQLNSNASAIEGSLQYSYSLTSRTNNFLSNGLSLYFKTQIAKDFFVMTSFEYEFRPETGDFDFITNQIQTETDQLTGTKVIKSRAYGFKDEEVKNNLLFFKLGIVRQF